MTQITWKAAVSGGFKNAALWDADRVPGPSDDAVLPAFGTYTVSLKSAVTLKSLTSAAILVVSAPVETDRISGNFVNNGALILDHGTAGGTLSVGGSLTGTGTIAIDDSNASGTSGGTRVFIAGTLADSGTVTIGNAGLTSATVVSVGKLTYPSHLNLTGNTTPGSAGTATLNVAAKSASQITTDIFLAGAAKISFGSGAITSIGIKGRLTFDGNAAQIDIKGQAGKNSALAFTTMKGELDVTNGARLNLSGSVTNNGRIVVTSGSTFVYSGDLTNYGGIAADETSKVTIHGSLIDKAKGPYPGVTSAYGGYTGAGPLIVDGTLSGGGYFGSTSLTKSVTYKFGSVTNLGYLHLLGGEGANSNSRVTFDSGTTAAPDSVSNIEIDGNARVLFASGAITQVFGVNSTEGGYAGGLVLDGANAQINVKGQTGINSAIAITSIDASGGVALFHGASITSPGDVTNNGIVNVDGASRFTVNGSFDNLGEIYLHYDVLGEQPRQPLYVRDTFTDSGMLMVVGSSTQAIVVSFNDLVLAGGTIDLYGTTPGLRLDAGSGVAPTVLSGSTKIVLRDNAELDFASGGITTIGQDATLSFFGGGGDIHISGTSGDNTGLKLSENDGRFDLLGSITYDNGQPVLYSAPQYETPGDFLNKGTFQVTMAEFTTNGALTNASGGLLYIAGTVHAASLENDGSLYFVQPSVQDGPAVLLDAPLTGTGVVSVETSAEFTGAVGSGETFVFYSGGELTLDHPQDFAGVISGFSTGNSVDLVGFGPNSTLSFTSGGTHDSFTIVDGNMVAHIALASGQSHDGFSLRATNGGELLVQTTT